jgi:hypothetical protein
MTKRVVLALVVAMSFAACLGAPRAWSQVAELPARVATLAGGAELLAPGASAWKPASLRAEVGAGASVRTVGIGRVAVMTGAGHALRLGSSTQIRILGVEESGADGPRVRATLDAGRLWVAVAPAAGPRPRVEVLAGPVSVRVRGSGVALRTDRDGSVLVRVYHGSAVCAAVPGRGEWQRELKGGEELRVPAAGAPAGPGRLTHDEAEALWVRWNEEQDAAGYGGPAPG